ncbi:MAG: hypothetical protein AAGF94_19175 [Pseudomonadota bacterium]
MSEYLQTPGLTIEGTGVLDNFDRELVVLRLPDGTTIGQRLIDEGFARELSMAVRKPATMAA